VTLRVHTLPGLAPARALTSRSGPLPEPFASRPTRFTYLGRYAIWHALEVLGLGRGARVAFPAFHCGAELIPLLERGVRPRYYGVDRTLRADMASVERAIASGVDAVFVTHVLGVPQRIDAIERTCLGHDVPLIEDCAHTLTGRCGERPLGTFGDVSIFSMRKLLPMPDGGALCINARSLAARAAPAAGPPPPFSNLAGNASVRMGQYLEALDGVPGGLFRACVAAPASRVYASRPKDDAPRFFPDRIAWGMSRISERILRSADLEEMARRRRENLAFLAERVVATEHIEPLPLPADTCPLMFPVVAKEPERFVLHLRRRGIQSSAYWNHFPEEFPFDDFPEAAALKRDLLGLPIHQGLDRTALESIVAALRE